MTIESVLILTLLVTIFIAVSAAFRDNQLLSQLVHGPWSRLSGMIKYGTWVDEKDGAGTHPNSRIQTPKGDDPQ